MFQSKVSSSLLVLVGRRFPDTHAPLLLGRPTEAQGDKLALCVQQTSCLSSSLTLSLLLRPRPELFATRLGSFACFSSCFSYAQVCVDSAKHRLGLAGRRMASSSDCASSVPLAVRLASSRFFASSLAYSLLQLLICSLLGPSLPEAASSRG